MHPVDKATRKEKEDSEAEIDPSLRWEKEDDELEGRKPDLAETEEDPAGL
ncbi:MAG: hypothetical protein ABI824_10125 [Acidobacteriota bacterium]